MKATLFSRVPYMGPAPGGVWPVPPAAFAPEAAEQSMDAAFEQFQLADLDLLAQKLVFIETCVQELRTLARPAEIQRDVREARFVLHTLVSGIRQTWP